MKSSVQPTLQKILIFSTNCFSAIFDATPSSVWTFSGTVTASKLTTDTVLHLYPPPAQTCPLHCVPACWQFPLQRWWSALSSTAWWQEGWTSHRSLCSLGCPPTSNRWCGWSGTLVYLSKTERYYLSHLPHLYDKSAFCATTRPKLLKEYLLVCLEFCGSQLNTQIKGEAELDDQRHKNDLLRLNPQIPQREKKTHFINTSQTPSAMLKRKTFP